MTMSRADVRPFLTNLFANDGQMQYLVQLFADYPIANWGTNSPVLVVSSVGDNSPALTHAGAYNQMLFDIHTFVTLGDDGTLDSDAMDILDAIAARIAELLVANRGKTDVWYAISQSGMSQVVPEVIAGTAYLHEIRQVQVNAR